MEQLDIQKVSKILSSDPSAVKNWRQIYDVLQLCPGEAVNLTKCCNTGVLTSYELFSKILTRWITNNPRHATTIQNLKILLEKLGFESAAENITEFKKEFKNASVGSVQHNYEAVVENYVPRPIFEKEIIEGLKKIENNDCNICTQINFPVVVLHGIGGNGKTVLCRKVCELVRSHVDLKLDRNFIWINAEDNESINKEFANFLLLHEDNNKEDTIETIKQYYKTQFRTTKCLLIFDNVKNFKSLRGYLPLNLETEISVLITSNFMWKSGEFGKVKNIAVNTFTPDEFTYFVKNMFPNEQLSILDIEKLGEYTGKIPYLARIVCYGLESWGECRDKLDIDQYLWWNETSNLNQDTNKLTDLFINYVKSPQDIVKKQMSLIKNSGVYIEADGEIACKLLIFLAYCESDVEMLYLKTVFIEKLKSSNCCGNMENYFDASVNILIRQGFVHKNKSRLSIHRSYQDAVRMINKRNEQNDIENLLCLKINPTDAERCLNYALLFDLGIEYGNEMLEKMINSSHFFLQLLRQELTDRIKVLFDHAKKSKKEVNWILFGNHNFGVSPHFLLNHKEMYSDLIIENEDFVGLLNNFDKDERNLSIDYKLLGFVSLIAFRHTRWLELVVKTFPNILYSKFPMFNESFLHIATLKGEILSLDFFIQKKLDINEIDNFGDTPLHYAAYFGKFEIVETLLQHKAEPNIQNKDLWTPLHYAVWEKRDDIIKILILNGADPNIKNIVEQTAIDIAIDEKKKEIVILWETYQAKLNSKLNLQC